MKKYLGNKTACERGSKMIFGEAYIDSIAKEIQDAFPGIKGFNKRGLYRMKQILKPTQMMNL